MKCPIAISLVLAAGVVAQPQPQSPADRQAIVEFRRTASPDYDVDGIAFDIAAEKLRLSTWLDVRGNRSVVQADGRAIHAFNALAPDEGGPVSRHFAWYPHVIRTGGGEESLYYGAAEFVVVPMFSQQQYEEPADGAVLVELVAINLHAPHFTDRDFDPNGVEVVGGSDGSGPRLAYKIVDERRAAFRDWSGGLIGKRCAVIVDREVRSVPTFVAAVDGAGVIAGRMNAEEMDLVARRIRGEVAAEPPAPAVTETVVMGAADGPTPAGADPADIRAMQGAEAMLEAEARLQEMMKAGKIGGVDRIVTFEEISSWLYEDGLLGLPEGLKGLDGQQVLMTGFMLPIDEVENIEEFLLVQSLWSCCYGQPPDINGIVRVVMKGDARLDYQFDPIKVIGTFRVEATTEDGYCVDIYQLHADSVEIIR